MIIPIVTYGYVYSSISLFHRLKLKHGWVTTSNSFVWMKLLIYVVILMLVKVIFLSKIGPCLRKMQVKFPVENLWNAKTWSLLGFVRTQSSYYDRGWIIELPWRLTVCHSQVFWHQRLLATPFVSPLISQSAYAGFLSYTFTTLRYAVGDGKRPAGFLSYVSVTVCYRFAKQSYCIQYQVPDLGSVYIPWRMAS